MHTCSQRRIVAELTQIFGDFLQAYRDRLRYLDIQIKARSSDAKHAATFAAHQEGKRPDNPRRSSGVESIHVLNLGSETFGNLLSRLPQLFS